MLKGIPKMVSPALLKILCEMGHGDEIVIADANFPSETYGKRVVRADGISGNQILESVLTLIPLDTYAEENLILMQLTPSDVGKVNPKIWKTYEKTALQKDENLKIGYLERYAFYERAKNAYAVIATGEEEIYANLIIKKGVIR